MNLRTWARIFIAISFFLSGLAETLSATGLVAEVSPDRLWGPGTHTLAVGGPLQMVAAALLASGRKTRWALAFLVGYVCLGGAFWHLPRIFNPAVGGNAIGGLLSSMALLGGILYGLHGERTSSRRASPAKDRARNRPGTGLPIALSRGPQDRIIRAAGWERAATEVHTHLGVGKRSLDEGSTGYRPDVWGFRCRHRSDSG